MTDDELRAEVERRGLLVIVEPDDPYVGNFPAEGSTTPGTCIAISDGRHAWAWRSDLVEVTYSYPP